MRIHTVVGAYIFFFSSFFNLTACEYAVLCLTVCSVLCAEMINTAVEEITDLSSSSYNPLAKVTKDIAAGMVLLCAAFAVVIGFVLFFKPDYYMGILNYMLVPWRLLVFLFSLFISIAYIFLGPAGIAEIFRRGNKKINKG